MSVPTSEIPQARQDAARERMPAATWGRLAEATKDTLIRRIDAGRDSPPIVDAYRTLLDPPLLQSQSRFPDLSEGDQGSIVDTLTLRPSFAHALGLSMVVEAIFAGGFTGDVRTRAIELATRPLRANAVPDRDERRVFRAYLLSEHEERLSGLSTLLRLQAFASLGVPDRVRMIEVADACSSEGLLHLHRLLQTDHDLPTWSRVPRGTAPLVVRDLRGQGTALDHLHRLARGTIPERVGILPVVRQGSARGSNRTVSVVHHPRELAYDLTDAREIVDHAYVVGDLVTELAVPSRFVNQDNRGTCYVTVLLHRLALLCPAEYARLAADLVLSGSSTLQDGSALEPPTDGFPSDDSLRSVTERLTQSALMRYWEGPRYRNTLRTTRPDATNPTGRQSDGVIGTDPPWRAAGVRTATALFGGQWVGHDVALMETVRSRLQADPTRPVMVSIHLGRGAHMLDVHVVDSAPAPALLPANGHGSVLYWNPWSGSMIVWQSGIPRVTTGVGRTGTVQRGANQPTRLSVDGVNGMQRMTVADFRRALDWVLVQR